MMRESREKIDKTKTNRKGTKTRVEEGVGNEKNMIIKQRKGGRLQI